MRSGNEARQVSFSTTREEAAMITKIVERAVDEGLVVKGSHEGGTLDLSMDISATHCNGSPLDLEKFLAAPTFDFIHDVRGIQRHINRITGELGDCFSPRCAQHQKPSRDIAITLPQARGPR